MTPAALEAYYTARGVPAPYLGYLIGAADGVEPFVYINGTTVKLVDARQVLCAEHRCGHDGAG